MRFSIWPSVGQPWHEVVDTVRHAEATRWDRAYPADHVMANSVDRAEAAAPLLEATAALSALAALTDRVVLAPLVLGMTYRHPAVVPNWAAPSTTSATGAWSWASRHRGPADPGAHHRRG